MVHESKMEPPRRDNAPITASEKRHDRRKPEDAMYYAIIRKLDDGFDSTSTSTVYFVNECAAVVRI